MSQNGAKRATISQSVNVTPRPEGPSLRPDNLKHRSAKYYTTQATKRKVGSRTLPCYLIAGPAISRADPLRIV